MSKQIPKALLSTIRYRVFKSRGASIQSFRFLSDKSKEWIPPSRPLSGDKGQSHLYSDILDTTEPRRSVINEEDLEEEIKKFMREDQEANEIAQFIDLDELDLEDFKRRFDSGEIEANEGILDEDVDLDELLEAIQAMEAGELDDDDVDDEDEELFIDYDDHEEEGEGSDYLGKEDKFQKHFETSDFLESSKEAPDWLSTRRAKLSNPKAMGMMTPSDARKRRREPDIPVVKNTLLSSDEIINSLVNGGAQDVKLIVPEDELKSYFGWDGMIIATASSYTHIRVLTDVIVHSLRKRNLAELGVVGAKYGSEGGEDPTMSARARRKRNLGSGKKTDDGWMSVDCQNFIVHVQDEVTRTSVDLEGLWKPGSEQGKILRRLDPKDDDAVDDYVADNPIPDEYTESMMKTSDFWSSGGQFRGGYGSIKNVKSGRYTPTNNHKRKPKNRGRYAL